MKRTIPHKFFGALSTVIYLLVSVLPVHLACADSELDCGPHVVVGCDQHENVHFVREHIDFPSHEAFPQDEQLGHHEEDTSHDDHHVIEARSAESFCRTSHIKLAKKLIKQEVFQPVAIAARNSDTLKPGFSIDQHGSPLLFLRTVRLVL